MHDQAACDPGLEVCADPASANAVVSDDADWLRSVRSTRPAAVRFLVDGDALLLAGSVDLDVPHHVLTAASHIHDVRMVLATQSTETMEGLQAVSSKVRIPPLSRSIQELMAALDAPEVDASKVQKVLEKDPALVAKTLKLANSPMFQRRRAVPTLDRAIVLLGLANIRIAAMSSGFFRPVRGVPPEELEAARDTGILAVSAVRALAGAHAEVAATAALLLDIGRIVLMQHDPGYSTLTQEAAASGTPVHVAEREAYGTTHAEQGAWLLDSWGLPHEVCEAIALSHTPVPHPRRGRSTRLVVYVASQLVDAAQHDHPLPSELCTLLEEAQVSAAYDHVCDQLLLPAA